MNNFPMMGLSRRIKKSPFIFETLKAGASDFTVYNHYLMPINYNENEKYNKNLDKDDNEDKDYLNLINNVNLWDVSVQRQIQISGIDSTKFLNFVLTRNINNMKIGQCKYSLICDDNGIVINDPLLLKSDYNKYWLSIADNDIYLWLKGLNYFGNFKD